MGATYNFYVSVSYKNYVINLNNNYNSFYKKYISFVFKTNNFYFSEKHAVSLRDIDNGQPKEN